MSMKSGGGGGGVRGGGGCVDDASRYVGEECRWTGVPMGVGVDGRESEDCGGAEK
jgi:hypothetical protein